jgi:hypothetical protein
MGQKMVRFAHLGAARSRQDESMEVRPLANGYLGNRVGGRYQGGGRREDVSSRSWLSCPQQPAGGAAGGVVEQVGHRSAGEGVPGKQRCIFMKRLHFYYLGLLPLPVNGV